MSRVPAAGRLLRGQCRGSAAAVPLQPRGPPARQPSGCQNRHLGVGSAGRAATGAARAERVRACAVGRERKRPGSGAPRAPWRRGGVRMCRPAGRRGARGHVSRPAFGAGLGLSDEAWPLSASLRDPSPLTR